MIAIVTHAGVGSSRELDGLCDEAAKAGMGILERGGSALAAAVAATVLLEDDPRPNAGTGSILRLDGRTIEMDASVMDSTGRIGAVAAIRDVKNPVVVARQVAETPHVLLAGEGAIAFARLRGHPVYSPLTDNALRKYKDTMAVLHAADPSWRSPLWKNADVSGLWNFERPYREAVAECDTVGAVAVDRSGSCAVGTSTGGASAMLLGRVGDSPLPGCGFFAGPAGAVGTTGIGEEIIRKILAKTVYDWIAAGAAPQEACERGVALYPAEFMIGVIAAGPTGTGCAANRDMGRAERRI